MPCLPQVWSGAGGDGPAAGSFRFSRQWQPADAWGGKQGGEEWGGRRRIGRRLAAAGFGVWTTGGEAARR